MLAGSYEPRQTERFLRCVGPGDTVFDVGAHAGYYTLLASFRVGAGGRVFAFEPDPRNARYLRGNVAVNERTNVHVEEAAVSDREGRSAFGGGSGTGTRRLTGDGEMEVRTITLDGFRSEHPVVPSVIKVDVEGAEERLLRGARATLRGSRPVLFLSTHGEEVAEACLHLLDDMGYRTEPVDEDGTAGVSELVCFPGSD